MEEKKLFQYFIEQTNERFDKIDEKLETLISFRLLLLGASLTVATIFSVITTLITIAVSAH